MWRSLKKGFDQIQRGVNIVSEVQAVSPVPQHGCHEMLIIGGLMLRRGASGEPVLVSLGQTHLFQ